jgi:predicted membrane-bound spermidine synthase
METKVNKGPAYLNEKGRKGAWIRALCILFFVSGFPAIIYQLTWQRSLFRIFGVNIESVTIIVTAFMLGLGIGSIAGGVLSKNHRLPVLLALAAVELSTAAFGLISLPLFEAVGDLTIELSLPTTALVMLALVCVPTILMGATLPLLVEHMARHLGNVGGAVGLLYYVNTLGAGVACALSALFLFPFLTLSNSIGLAAAINLLIACGAVIAHFRTSGPLVTLRETACYLGPRSAPPLSLQSASALAAAVGFVSISYEIFFFRTISFATGSSAPAFALTLAAFLTGLAGGARRAGEACENKPDSIVIRSVGSLMKANLVGFLVLPLLTHIGWTGSAIVAVALLATYLSARFWGAFLPYLAGLSITQTLGAGMHTAVLYFANIIGSTTGSVVTGFVLMEHLSLAGTGALLAAEGSLCLIGFIGALRVPKGWAHNRALAAGLIGLLLAPMIPFGSTYLIDTLQWKRSIGEQDRLRSIVENRSGIISVAQDQTVYGNGAYDGRFNTDLVHDTNFIVRPYSLSLFHPAPRDVLMIGLSSGSWAQVIANNPDVESLTIIEINPGYFALIADEPEVASVLSNPKVRIVINDGRKWLRANGDRRFDAIVSNTTFFFRSNAANLLSIEFLQLVKQHLKKGGVFFYNTTSSNRVQRTGCLAFAHGARILNHLALSDQPIEWDFDRWRRTLLAYRIDGKPAIDLNVQADEEKLNELAGWQKNMEITLTDDKRPIEPCSQVLQRTTGMRTVTDDNMGSEWRYLWGME